MYEYKFVKIDIKGWLKRNPKEDYHRIVDEYAKDGWRLIQIFAPGLSGYGEVAFFELIFEKEKS
jgi:hypothetical protein